MDGGRGVVQQPTTNLLTKSLVGEGPVTPSGGSPGCAHTHLPKRAAAMIRETLKWTRSLRISIRDNDKHWHQRVVVPNAMAIASPLRPEERGYV